MSRSLKRWEEAGTVERRTTAKGRPYWTAPGDDRVRLWWRKQRVQRHAVGLYHVRRGHRTLYWGREPKRALEVLLGQNKRVSTPHTPAPLCPTCGQPVPQR